VRALARLSAILGCFMGRLDTTAAIKRLMKEERNGRDGQI